MARFVLSLKSTFAQPSAWRSLLALIVALALTASCSGDDEGRSPKKASPPDTDSEWAVHVYVGAPGAWKRFDFGPVPEVSFPAGHSRAQDPCPARRETYGKRSRARRRRAARAASRQARSRRR